MEKESKQILLDNGIQPTNQRLIILDYLRKTPEHPSCENIYEELSKVYPIMNLTTIYNTVKLLVEKKIVSPIFLEKKCHYGFVDKEHGHFICKKCKKIIDLDVELNPNENLKNFIIDEQNISYLGMCSECVSEQKKEEIV